MQITNPTAIKNDSVKISKTTIYFELLGNAYFYSFNYDRLIYIKNKFKISTRAGISYFPNLLISSPTSKNSKIYSHNILVPVELNLIKKKKNNIEFGIGETMRLLIDKNEPKQFVDDFAFIPVARLGYRYQQTKGGVFISAALLTYFFILENKHYYSRPFSPFVGLGIGYTFKNKKT